MELKLLCCHSAIFRPCIRLKLFNVGSDSFVVNPPIIGSVGPVLSLVTNKLTCLNLLFRLSFMLKLSCLQRQRAPAKVGKAWTFIFGRSLFIFLNIVILCTVIIDVGLVIDFDSCHVLCT